MVNVPKNVQKVVEECAAKYPSDIEKATEEAERRIVKLPEYRQLVKSLVRKAIQEMIYDARHVTNVRIKRETSRYGGTSKITVGDSASVLEIQESVYNYQIAGTVLGSLLGRDLPAITDSERAIGNGHLVNSTLCSYLSTVVPSDKQVREAVTEKRLRNLFRRAEKTVKETKAA